MEKQRDGRPKRVSDSEEVKKVKEMRGGRGCRGQGMDGMREILSQETIQTQNRRQIILNGLIYEDSDSEQRRDANIKKLEDLLNLKQRSPGNHSRLLCFHLLRLKSLSPLVR
jgi:hypothetical protein